MSDNDEIDPHRRSLFDMDEAFCARIRMAVEAGLERAPIGVVTTPGTNNPKYVPTEHPCRLVSPLVDRLVALCPAGHFRLGCPTRKYLKATCPSPGGNKASHFRQRTLPCTTSQASTVTILYSASQLGQRKGIGFDWLIVAR